MSQSSITPREQLGDIAIVIISGKAAEAVLDAARQAGTTPDRYLEGFVIRADQAGLLRAGKVDPAIWGGMTG